VQLGLEPRHGVGLLGFNSPQWFVANFAAIFAGFVNVSREIRADLLFVYKLLVGFTVLRADHYFSLSERSVTRQFKLFLPRCFTNVRKSLLLQWYCENLERLA